MVGLVLPNFLVINLEIFNIDVLQFRRLLIIIFHPVSNSCILVHLFRLFYIIIDILLILNLLIHVIIFLEFIVDILFIDFFAITINIGTIIEIGIFQHFTKSFIDFDFGLFIASWHEFWIIVSFNETSIVDFLFRLIVDLIGLVGFFYFFVFEFICSCLLDHCWWVGNYYIRVVNITNVTK